MAEGRLGMSQDEEWAKQDDKVHDHVPHLGREHEPGVVEVTSRTRDGRIPLRLEGDAADHAQDNEDEVPRTQDGNEAVAEALVRPHDTDADVLLQDGQLEEEVRQGVQLGNGDADLEDAVLAMRKSRMQTAHPGERISWGTSPGNEKGKQVATCLGEIDEFSGADEFEMSSATVHHGWRKKKFSAQRRLELHWGLGSEREREEPTETVRDGHEDGADLHVHVSTCICGGGGAISRLWGGIGVQVQ
jgi:hypothetical protein